MLSITDTCNYKEGQWSLTDYRKVHFQPNMFKELIAIHVWHMNITQYHIKTTFPFPQKIQSHSSLSACGNWKIKTQQVRRKT